MSNADEQKDPSPNKGGFGAFSQQYRDRWATGHPGAGQSGQSAKPGTPAPAPSTGEAAGTEPTQP